MPSYVEAFRRGLEKADAATKNKAEIQEVIAKLSEDLRAASGGAIQSVRVAHLERKSAERGLHVIDPARPFPGRVVKYSALVAYGGAGGISQELCECTFASSGYPVTLAYSWRDVLCHDRGGLETALLEMLEQPEIGERLAKLLGGNPAAPETAAADA